MKKTYKYILLDWDGNMINTLPIWLEGYRKCAKYFHKKFSDKFIVKNLFGNLHAYKLYGVDTREEFDKKLLEEFVNPELKKASLFPKVLTTVKKLRERGAKIAVVSSSKRNIVEYGLKRFGIDKLIEALVASDDVKNHKPHPESLLKAMNLIGANIEETVIVGDGEKDTLAGQAIGIDTILYYPKINHLIYSRKTINLLNATYVVESFDEILIIF